jgi:[NiFe] hydrogenase diaphorase moiety large subunit
MLSTEQAKIKQEITALVDQNSYDRSNLIKILQSYSRTHDKVSSFDMQVIADLLDIPPVEVYSVLSYYPSLKSVFPYKFNFRLCRAPISDFSGEKEIAGLLEEKLGIPFEGHSDDNLFSLDITECAGLCDQMPVLLVNDHLFTKVDTKKAEEIIQSCKDGKLLPGDDIPNSIKNTLSFDSIKPFSGQKNIQSRPRAEIIKTLKSAPKPNHGNSTSTSGDFNRAIKDGVDRIVCNVDEGEPFSYKNRALLIKYIDLILEGMAISAYLCDASQGILYLPSRYAYMQDFLQSHIDDFSSSSNFTFNIEVFISPAPYGGREDSMLIAALEGGRPEPSTNLESQNSYLIKSADAFAWTAYLCANNGDWPQDIESELPALPMIAAVSGDCAQPGVYELQPGITIAEMLKLTGAEQAQAVQLGGISGKLIPSDAFETPISSSDLAERSAILIYGEQRDLIKVSREILTYFTRQSCGQCIPCRIGIPYLLDYITCAEKGQKPRVSVSEIRSLAETIHLTSKCNLGQSAPKAFLSVLDIFTE